jgi:hypothetical protein
MLVAGGWLKMVQKSENEGSGGRAGIQYEWGHWDRIKSRKACTYAYNNGKIEGDHFGSAGRER